MSSKTAFSKKKEEKKVCTMDSYVDILGPRIFLKNGKTSVNINLYKHCTKKKKKKKEENYRSCWK